VYAIGAIQELKQQGFSVPEDIAVISMDNILLSKYIEPPLTTIKFDKPEMGEVAVDTAIRLINSEYSGPKKIFFHGSLVERCSVDREQDRE
jgi:DNA-binding LacI/PurR family transcriptional regulator